jgi:hypothetical protein
MRIVIGFEFPEDLARARKIFHGQWRPTTWRRRSIVYDDGEYGVGTALEAIEVLLRQGFTFRVETTRRSA